MRLVIKILYKYLPIGILSLGIFLIFEKFAYLRLNTADASIYLSTAENIAQHHAFVVSYNLCQCFNTLTHPIWPYYQFLYSLFCALFINHGGILEIIKINILLFALNVALVFYLIQELIPTRFNYLFVTLLAFSLNFYISSIYAWTEQFYFFFFILTFILFLKFKTEPKHLFALGIGNAVLMLIRVSHLYSFLAYLPVLFIGKDSLRQKIIRAVALLSGFVIAYGLYQLFCFSVYHTFYPEYARPGASYGLAKLTSGILYQSGKIGIQAHLSPLFAWHNFLCIAQHLKSFYHQMPFFCWVALFYYFIPKEKRQDGGAIELCFLQSIFLVLGYSVTFYWLPPYFFETLRYSLIPYVLMSVAGWYCFYTALNLSESWVKKLLGLMLFLALLMPTFNSFFDFSAKIFRYPPSQSRLMRDLFESYQWIDTHLPEHILVASNEDQQAYFLHRPFISIPPGRSFNCTNLLLYNKIYQPDYYLLSSSIPDKCFSVISNSKIFSNRTFRVLKVIKG